MLNQKIFTITEITRAIKSRLENDPALSGVWIKGEISNLTLHSSGHIYFTLKDEKAVISAVFFRNSNRHLNFKMEEGMSVMAYGSLSLFEKRGSYQFNVTQLKLEGIGELQKKIEQLKEKLLKEGVFDEGRKRPLPFLPRTIGLATSPTGAAVRDILKVALRRYPNIRIVIAPAIVQGEGAQSSIIKAIEELNRPEYEVDVIIVGRGGGSFEDLMPFNEEDVVKAVYSSRLPVISAVGHQIDHPLTDDAADAYAPTPSAAAELCVPQKSELLNEADYLSQKILTAVTTKMRELSAKVQNASDRKVFKAPIEIVNIKSMILSDIEHKMIISLRNLLNQASKRLNEIPDINYTMKQMLKDRRYAFRLAIEKIEQLSPIGVMRRGYSVAFNESGSIIKQIGDVGENDYLKLFLSDGSLDCRVNKIIKGETIGKQK